MVKSLSERITNLTGQLLAGRAAIYARSRTKSRKLWMQILVQILVDTLRGRY